MCGVNGIVTWKRDPVAIVDAMNRHLGHRGPDGNGVFEDGKLALGHVRLSILDLTDAGAQPMIYNHWVVTYNGEIYNFKRLRDELTSLGYQFKSRSDTEVLLKAWDHWGSECLHKFEGMFAFGILDKRDSSLFLCRDAYGVKPLYFNNTSNEFIFSSELATLVYAQDENPEPDRDALATFLMLHYIPAPQTGLLGFHKLPAGHWMKVDFRNDGIKVSRPVQWHRPFQPLNDSVGVTVDALDSALARSVRQQMVSDVPVGAFLSGGVDSSLICHYASMVHSDPLHTFSIGFSDAGNEYDETRYAARAAKVIGAVHHPVQVELGGLTDQIDVILSQMGELNADTSVFLNYIICAEARKYVKVCLSGAGGDEMFGGYYRYQALMALEMLNWIPQPLTRLLRTILNRLPQNRDNPMGNLVRRMNRFLEQRELVGSNFLTLVRQDSAYRQKSTFFEKPPITTLENAMAFDFQHFLGDNIFSFSDKMSMLHGLEVRVPFMDPGVVCFAENLRNNQRVSLFEKKILLKKLAVRYFPRNLIYRKKQGFAAPIEVWLRKLPKPEIKARCLGCLTLDMVSEEHMDELINKFVNHKKDLSLQIYAMIVLNQWASKIGL